ncbi:hypothetical protein [Chitinophaga barathri]|uniref:Circularly permuted type 2 ATP-grasp protein n=1 Tax=Chitinophaga barathri TaxID=1647451 RepID=A0A3N4M8S8_9BACT|nr:hypothetical protein [Chitinophaga barathri]RPD39818.1 hypothetical protein EG028_16940 [Chitinophaga barathri]
MIPSIRQAYNQQFTPARYADLLASLTVETGVTPAFRVAETPVFVPKALQEQLIAAGDAVIEVILRPDLTAITEAAIPKGQLVPKENHHAQFIIIDFAITRNEAGELAPQLIELQGFPSLFGFQELLARQYRRHTDVPDTYSTFGPGLDLQGYVELLRRCILGTHHPSNVILLEVMPQQQKTLIDFVCTEAMLGIPAVCVSDLIQEGKKLYYLRNGERVRVQRIYNRMISEDVAAHREQLGDIVNFQHELEVEWATHPNWYYRISKFLLPFIHGPFAPKAWFLHELPVLPQDLENYVLKPLFSFAGQGVIIDPTPADVEKIEDPENWILQQKVEYAAAIETPTGPAKCEIRLMYCWPDDAPAPILAQNLARLSKGKMIGVNYNRDLDWVGGSSCFFEP